MHSSDKHVWNAEGTATNSKRAQLGLTSVGALGAEATPSTSVIVVAATVCCCGGGAIEKSKGCSAGQVSGTAYGRAQYFKQTSFWPSVRRLCVKGTGSPRIQVLYKRRCGGLVSRRKKGLKCRLIIPATSYNATGKHVAGIIPAELLHVLAF